MSFEEIKTHFEEEGCSLNQIENGVYIVRSCINGNDCMFEKLDFYGSATLCHYLHELNIDIPEQFVDYYHIYTNSREDLNKKHHAN